MGEYQQSSLGIFTVPGWPCMIVLSWHLTGVGFLYAALFLSVVQGTIWVLELLTMATEAALLPVSLIFFPAQWASLGKLF